MFAQVTVEGSANTFGDAQLSVDVIADEIMWEVAKGSEVVAYGASEEEPEIVKCNPKGEYTICWDPLDGSSIVDNNWAVGTIIGVFVRGVLLSCGARVEALSAPYPSTPSPRSGARRRAGVGAAPSRDARNSAADAREPRRETRARNEPRPKQKTRAQVGLEVRQGRRRPAGRHGPRPGHVLGGFVRPAHDGRRGFR